MADVIKSRPRIRQRSANLNRWPIQWQLFEVRPILKHWRSNSTCGDGPVSIWAWIWSLLLMIGIYLLNEVWILLEVLMNTKPSCLTIKRDTFITEQGRLFQKDFLNFFISLLIHTKNHWKKPFQKIFILNICDCFLVSFRWMHKNKWVTKSILEFNPFP